MCLVLFNTYLLYLDLFELSRNLYLPSYSTRIATVAREGGTGEALKHVLHLISGHETVKFF